MPFPASPVRALEAVADFLYPPRCLLCGSSIQCPLDGICSDCAATMTPLDPSAEIWRASEWKLGADGLVEVLHSLFLFEKEGVLQRALHLLKYGGMHTLGVRFGVELGRSLESLGRMGAVDLVVPVPLHGAKLRERGYNQSAKICAGIRSATGAPVDHRVLKRIRHTPSQTTLKLHEREANVRDAFIVPRGRVQGVQGRSILLVDDVLTTGATLRSSARALKDAGASSVICATVAIAP